MKVKCNLSDLCFCDGCLHQEPHEEMTLLSTLEKCSSEHTCGEAGVTAYCREEEEGKIPSKEEAALLPA